MARKKINSNILDFVHHADKFCIHGEAADEFQTAFPQSQERSLDDEIALFMDYEDRHKG